VLPRHSRVARASERDPRLASPAPRCEARLSISALIASRRPAARSSVRFTLELSLSCARDFSPTAIGRELLDTCLQSQSERGEGQGSIRDAVKSRAIPRRERNADTGLIGALARMIASRCP